ncbi:MAG: trimeric autotransporter adhesin [Thermoleophilaceae bacterium]|nr:trimeric autotransporter adhesin [Thermoleophilaceae bacterium]
MPVLTSRALRSGLLALGALVAFAGPAQAQSPSSSPPRIGKSFSPSTVPTGGTTTLFLTLANPQGNGPLTGVSFTDTLPAGTQVGTPSNASNGCGGTLTAADGSSSITLTGGTLTDDDPDNDTTCTISLDIKVTTTGDHNNRTSAPTSNESGPGTQSNIATVTGIDAPTFAQDFADAAIPVGGTSSVTFTVTNPNTGNDFGLNFTDSLPDGLVVATPNGASGTCGGDIAADPGSSSVVLSGATVDPSSSCTVTVAVAGTSRGSKTNTAGPLQFDYDNGSGDRAGATGPTASDSIYVVGPPAVAPAFSPASIRPGGTSALSFTVSNPNPDHSLAGVGFTDTLAGDLIVASPNGASGSCGGGTVTAAPGGHSIQLSGGALAAGATCTVSVNVTAPGDGVKTTTATASSSDGGTGPAASASMAVAAPPSIAAAFTDGSIGFGSATPLTLTISNPNAKQALSGVAVAAALPDALVVSSSPNASNSCGGTFSPAPGASSVALSGGSVPAGGSCAVAVSITGRAPGTFTVTTGNVTSSEGGDGNAASASVTVNAPSVLPKQCVVPSLRGLRLHDARVKLGKAKCSLGSLVKPSHRPRHAVLVVSKTSPAKGTTTAAFTRVKLTMKYRSTR